MTGRYAHNHGVLTNPESGNLDQSTTIQRYLQESGFRTGFFGKFLNEWDVHQAPPYFDDWAMTPTSGRYFGATYNVRGHVRIIDRYATTFLHRRVQRFLDESEEVDDTPWFAYVNWVAPHGPAIPQKKYQNAPVPAFKPPPSMFENRVSVDPTRRLDKPPYVQASNDSTFDGVVRTRRKKLRTLMSVDERMGQLRSLLRGFGETNTLVIYSSDNGLMWREHLIGGKGVPYTEAIKIPMFVRWPGHVEPGSFDARIVSNVDIASTIMAAAGTEADPSTPLDGRDIVDTSWTRDRLLAESWRQRSRDAPMWASLIRPGDQYIEYYGSDGMTVNFREYYDAVNDPWQLVNLLGDDDLGNDPPPPTIAQLSAQLMLDRDCSGDSCP